MSKAKTEQERLRKPKTIVTIACQQCGVEKNFKGSLSNQKFCSRDCFYAYRRENPKVVEFEKECMVCSVIYFTIDSAQRTCSHKCATTLKHGPEQMIQCSFCQTQITGFRKGKKPIYCSKECQVNAKPRYWMNQEEVESLLEEQNYVCAICKKPEAGLFRDRITGETRIKGLSLDHDHTSNEFRGFLCSNCNTGLGLFKDNEESLVEAILYLQRGGFEYTGKGLDVEKHLYKVDRSTWVGEN